MATATLLIPRVIARQLTEITQLGEFTIFPATARCKHWAVYDEHKNEIACPCSPLESDARLLIRTMTAILNENFVARTETVSLPHVPPDHTPQTSESYQSTRTYQDSTATSKPPAQDQPQQVSTTRKIPIPQQIPVITAQTLRKNASHKNTLHEDTERNTAPAAHSPAAAAEPAPAKQPQPPTRPIPQTSQPPASQPGNKTAPANPPATGPIPNPAALAGKFKPLTYKPPAIVEYYSNHNKEEQPERQKHWSLKHSEAIPAYTLSRENRTELPARRAPHPLEIRPGMLKHLKNLRLEPQDITRIIEYGTAEKINNWVTSYTHENCRVELNTSSNTVLDVIDERGNYSNYNTHPENTEEDNALPYTFAPAVEHYMVMRNIPYDRIIRVIESPYSVDPAPSWLTAYSDSEYRVLLAPDGRTIRSIKPLEEN